MGLRGHRDPPDDSITKDQGQFVPLAASVNLRVYEVCAQKVAMVAVDRTGLRHLLGLILFFLGCSRLTWVTFLTWLTWLTHCTRRASSALASTDTSRGQPGHSRGNRGWRQGTAELLPVVSGVMLCYAIVV